MTGAPRPGGDFTSGLYLGLTHPSGSLPGWGRLTTGRPAALAPPAGERAVAAALARLVGAERGLLAPSTLHLMWDVFDVLARGAGGRLALYVDAAVYPVARWGVERGAQRGARVRRFAHLSAASLRACLTDGAAGLRPVVVTDGFCPGCGRAAPLAEYRALVAPLGGLVVVDDTQALGVLGTSPSAGRPYGVGGGGTLRWTGAAAGGVLVVASLAKAFGAPVAALLGDGDEVARFEAASETRVHCSPPSAAAVQAAASALAINAQQGDALRERLSGLVRRFRARVITPRVELRGGVFPIQSAVLAARGDESAAERGRAAQTALRRGGTAAVLQRGHGDGATRLTFLITATHHAVEVDRAAWDLAGALGAPGAAGRVPEAQAYDAHTAAHA